MVFAGRAVPDREGAHGNPQPPRVSTSVRGGGSMSPSADLPPSGIGSWWSPGVRHVAPAAYIIVSSACRTGCAPDRRDSFQTYGARDSSQGRRSSPSGWTSPVWTLQCGASTVTGCLRRVSSANRTGRLQVGSPGFGAPAGAVRVVRSGWSNVGSGTGLVTDLPHTVIGLGEVRQGLGDLGGPGFRSEIESVVDWLRRVIDSAGDLGRAPAPPLTRALRRTVHDGLQPWRSRCGPRTPGGEVGWRVRVRGARCRRGPADGGQVCRTNGTIIGRRR